MRGQTLNPGVNSLLLIFALKKAVFCHKNNIREFYNCKHGGSSVLLFIFCSYKSCVLQQQHKVLNDCRTPLLCWQIRMSELRDSHKDSVLSSVGQDSLFHHILAVHNQKSYIENVLFVQDTGTCLTSTEIGSLYRVNNGQKIHIKTS